MNFTKNKLDNIIIGIFAPPGEGKTLLATLIAWAYDFVWAVYDIHWHDNFYRIRDYTDIENLKIIRKWVNIKKKWLLIIDEVNVNFSNQNFQSKSNKWMWKFLMLSRKLNLDVMFVWQRAGWADKVIREMCRQTWAIRKFEKSNGDLDIIVNCWTNKWWLWNLDWERHVLTKRKTYRSCLETLKLMWLSYDTTDLSILSF